MPVGRPKKKPSEMLVEVPCKVPSPVAKTIEELAVATDRSRSQIARKLITRGLAAYRRDGLLDDVEVPDNPFPEFAGLPIVMADQITQADASARPVAIATPKKG